MIESPFAGGELGPYIVGELEVCIVDEPSKVVRRPRLHERQILDDYFATPESRDTATGKVFRLYGSTFPGIDGLVLTYPAATGSGSSPSQTTEG